MDELKNLQAEFTNLQDDYNALKAKAAQYFQISRVALAELYAICPAHPIFVEAFTDETMVAIRQDSIQIVLTSPFKKVEFTSESKELCVTFDLEEQRKEITALLKKEIKNEFERQS